MARTRRKSKAAQQPRIDRQDVYRLIDQGHTQGEVSRQLHCDPSYISRLLKARRQQGVPTITPMVYPEDAAVSPLVTPTVYPGLDALTQRVEVLEAFIATMQERGIPVSPNGTPHLTVGIPVSPTTKHSFVIAVDMLDALQRYAASHHAEIRAVLDLALRTFFAHVAQEVPDA